MRINRPSNAPLLLLWLHLCIVPMDGKAAQPETQVVVVEAAGDDVEQATENALRGAVARVVGTFVDSQTMVKNDRLLEDQVLTYTGGFVRKYTLLTLEERGGEFHARVKVEVETRAIGEKLREIHLISKDIDGRSLAAQYDHTRERIDEARQLIKAGLRPFVEASHIRVLPTWSESVALDGSVQMGVRFESNREVYRLAAKRLTRHLEALGFIPTIRPIEFLTIENNGQPFKEYHDFVLPRSTHKGLKLVLIAINRDDALEVRIFELPQAFVDREWMSKSFAGAHAAYRAYFVDKEGDEIGSSELCLRLPAGPCLSLSADAAQVAVDLRGIDYRQEDDGYLQIHPWFVDRRQFERFDFHTSWSIVLNPDQISNLVSTRYEFIPVANLAEFKGEGEPSENVVFRNLGGRRVVADGVPSSVFGPKLGFGSTPQTAPTRWVSSLGLEFLGLPAGGHVRLGVGLEMTWQPNTEAPPEATVDSSQVFGGSGLLNLGFAPWKSPYIYVDGLFGWTIRERVCRQWEEVELLNDNTEPAEVVVETRCVNDSEIENGFTALSRIGFNVPTGYSVIDVSVRGGWSQIYGGIVGLQLGWLFAL